MAAKLGMFSVTNTSVTVPVGRGRKMRTALRTKETARFVTLPSEKKKKHMLFTSREVRLEKNCARGLEVVLGWYSRPNFPNTDRPRLVNNIFIFFLKQNEILFKRTRLIKGCDYGKIFRKPNNFWASKW